MVKGVSAWLWRVVGFCALLCVALPALGAQVSVRMDTDTLEVGQSGRLTVYMIDGRTKHAPRLEAPDGVELTFVGSSQEFRQGPNFRRTLVVGFKYRVTALAEGAIPIGPFQFEMTDGTEVRSEALVLSVVPRTESSEVDPILVEAGFGVADAWVGQVVVYSHELTARVPTMGVQWQLPEFEGFRNPRHGQAVNQNFVIDDLDGQVTKVFGHQPLLATATGEKSLAPTLVQVRIPPGRPNFFGVRNYNAEVRSSKPVSLRVRPLPEEPEGFSGLVGDFVFRSTFDRTEAAVGESVNWTLEMLGDGAIEGYEPPDFVDEDRISLYDNGGTVDARLERDGTYLASATFKRVLVPTEVGELALDPIQVVTFNPRLGEYEVHEIAVDPITVRRGREGAATQLESFGGDVVVVEGSEVDELAFRENYRWGSARTPPLALTVGALTLFTSTPAGAVLLLLGLARVRDWRQARIEARTRPPRAADHLRHLPSDPERRLTALDGALRLALSEHAQVSPSMLDRAEVLRGLPESIRDRVISLSDALDRARFSGLPTDRDLEADVREVVAALEEGS